MNAVSLATALSMGFLGSLHCAGMCGPIMLILPFQHFSGWKKIVAIGLYHFGRISIYALMGLVLHSFKSLFQPQLQQYISLGLGALLLLTGIYSFYAKGNGGIRFPWLEWVKKQTGRFVGSPDFGSLFVAGTLNGLLPCGLVYMALSLAATASSTSAAITSMYVFGVGTLPMLVGITLIKSRMSMLHLQSLKKYVPVLMFAFGGLLVLRGMNLGIPYLSPQVMMEHQEVKSACCQKH